MLPRRKPPPSERTAPPPHRSPRLSSRPPLHEVLRQSRYFNFGQNALFSSCSLFFLLLLSLLPHCSPRSSSRPSSSESTYLVKYGVNWFLGFHACNLLRSILFFVNTSRFAIRRAMFAYFSCAAPVPCCNRFGKKKGD